ncbi:MAG: phosphatase PAP2 family protein [Patescibacteria group bacterium]|jgi:undecaprenyl-diphosphatase
MDFEIVKALNSLNNSWVNSFSFFISWIPFILIILAIISIIPLIYDKNKGKEVFIAIVLAVITYFIISEDLLKYILPFKQRPYLAYPHEIRAVGKQFVDSSFPSNHIASVVSVLTVVVYYYHKYWFWSLLFVLIMAFSRMYNGMHYPTDVLAGAVLGIIYGLLAIKITKSIIKK